MFRKLNKHESQVRKTSFTISGRILAIVSWNLNDDYTYRIWISNLSPNIRAITYNGTITLFFQ